MSEKWKRGSWREPTPEWGDRAAATFLLALAVVLFAVAVWVSIPAALIGFAAGYLWSSTKWALGLKGLPISRRDK